MKVLIATLSVLALATGQQQLIAPFFNEGLLPYNDWQPQPVVPNVFNAYAGVPQPFLAAQQFPLVQPGFPGGQLLPPVPVPFPAQYPYALQQQQQLQQQQLQQQQLQQQQLQQLGQPLPLPVQFANFAQQGPLPLPLPPVNTFQQPAQFQTVRHGLPHSDAAAVSYSSLHYTNGNQQPAPTVTAPGKAVTAGVSTGGTVSVPAVTVPATPSLASGQLSVVKDIATFGTEYGTGADKSPVARYEAINAGSVHVAPLPGHTVDQKLVAPGTVNQKV